jgi:hypothetical protein
MHSDLLVMSGVLSDTYSAVQGISGMISDVDSALSSQFAATSGMVSDVYSAITGIPDVNIAQVNGSTIDGAGTEADPWGPA